MILDLHSVTPNLEMVVPCVLNGLPILCSEIEGAKGRRT